MDPTILLNSGTAELFKMGSVVVILILIIILLLMDRKQLLEKMDEKDKADQERQDKHNAIIMSLQEKTIESINSFKETIRDIARK